MELEGFLKAQYQYVNRICYEPPKEDDCVDFEYIGEQGNGFGKFFSLYNCMRPDCKSLHTTLFGDHLEDHYKQFNHEGLK